MRFNGDIEFISLGAGELKNAIVERLAGGSNGTLLPTGTTAAGRIAYNTDDNTYYFYDGSSWVAFGTGGNVAALQTEVDNIESASGGMYDTDGTFDAAVFGGFTNVSSPTDVLDALSQLDTAIEGADELAELNDVNVTGVTSGQFLQYDGANWVDHTIVTTDISGVTASSAELNILDGAIISTTELNYLDGATSNIQTQIDNNDTDISNLQTADDNLQTFVGSAGDGDSDPAYASTNYVTQGTDLTAAIGELDSALSTGLSTLYLDDLADVADSNRSGSPLTTSTTTGNAYLFAGNSGGNGYDVQDGTLGVLNNVASGVDSASNEDVLAFDGSLWTAITPGTFADDLTLGDIGDVTVSSPSAGDVLYYDAGSPAGWVHAAPGATSGVQPYDAGLTNLATGGTGIVSMSGDTVNFRTLSTGSSARITVSNGDGVSGNPTVDLATVANSGSGTFLKLTRDSYGRVSGTEAVVTADITALVDSTYVNESGDTMSGNLNMNGNEVFGLPTTPSGSSYATSKAYVDNLVSSGTTWRDPILDPDLVGIASAEPGSPTEGTGYIKYGGTQNETWGTLTNVVDYDFVYYTSGDWIRIENILGNSAARFGVAWEHGSPDSSLTNLGFAQYDLLEFDASGSPAADPTTSAGWSQPEGAVGPGSPEIDQGVTVLVSDPDSLHTGHSYLYDAENNQWIEISGPSSINAGTGLSYDGNTLNVNLGAGIVELPSDEVGLDIESGKAVQLTSTGTAGLLTLVLDGTTLTQSGSGLKVAADGITGTELDTSVAGDGLALNTTGSPATTQLDVDIVGGSGLVFTSGQLDLDAIPNSNLANSSINTAAESGSGSVSLGGTLTIAAGEGINTVDDTAGTITISGEDATTTNKGVASFNTNDFTVSSGAVSIKAAGVSNTQLVNSSITVAGDSGSEAIALGDTVTFVGGTLTTTSYNTTTNEMTIDVAASTSDLGDVTAAATEAGQVMVADGAGDYTPQQIHFVYDSATAGGSPSASTSHTVTHSLGQQYCNVTVVDDTDEVIIPESIVFTDANTVTVTFNTAIDCKVIVTGVPGVGLN